VDHRDRGEHVEGIVLAERKLDLGLVCRGVTERGDDAVREVGVAARCAALRGGLKAVEGKRGMFCLSVKASSTSGCTRRAVSFARSASARARASSVVRAVRPVRSSPLGRSSTPLSSSTSLTSARSWGEAFCAELMGGVERLLDEAQDGTAVAGRRPRRAQLLTVRVSGPAARAVAWPRSRPSTGTCSPWSPICAPPAPKPASR
jgi:hypothetical protein